MFIKSNDQQFVGNRQDQPLTVSTLTRNELAADSYNFESSLAVLQPDSVKGISAFELSKPSVTQQITNTLNDRGAVLVRELGVDSLQQAEDLLIRLGIEFDNHYVGGASPRSRLSDYFFTSTETPAPYVISYHTEMCYLPERPGKIFFYCITAPEKYGETPVFDCQQIWMLLPSPLKQKIEQLGLIYQRYFVAKKSRVLNVYKTWVDAFNVADRQQAEAVLENNNLQFEWQADGSLITYSKMPGVIKHPISGEKCLSLTLYNSESASYDLKKFSNRINPVSRFFLSAFMRLLYSQKNVFMRTLWGDGSEISAEETRQIIDTAWQASTLFKWQQHDLLLLDNIRYGHGRLNVKKPRKIAAALGDVYKLPIVTY